MRLNANQVNAVQNYLRGIPDTHCALCHQQEWKVSETVFALPEYTGASLMSLAALLNPPFPNPQYPPVESSWTRPLWNKESKEPEVFPVIPIVCGRCGFVFFLSAVAAGVVKNVPMKR
jgi:hypothetical protein